MKIAVMEQCKTKDSIDTTKLELYSSSYIRIEFARFTQGEECYKNLVVTIPQLLRHCSITEIDNIVWSFNHFEVKNLQMNKVEAI